MVIIQDIFLNDNWFMLDLYCFILFLNVFRLLYFFKFVSTVFHSTVPLYFRVVLPISMQYRGTTNCKGLVSLLDFFVKYSVIRCTFQILEGCQGRRTGVAVTTVSNSLILGGWVTKALKNGEKK